jgi:tRNA threonylcarbamoyladenosine biosynthesis protein TsaE
MGQDMEMVFEVEGPDGLGPVAAHLAALSATCPLFLFFGEMGAGKTTLIRELGRQLVVHDHMGSPTFSIVNEYLGDGGPVYHFDLYRIRDGHELDAIGFGEYLHSGYLCLVEWPEHAPLLLNEPHVRIGIRVEDGLRTITVTRPE